MWPWQWGRRQVEQAARAEQEAEERQQRAKRLIYRSREASRKLHIEYSKNSWNELFGEAFQGKGGAHQ